MKKIDNQGINRYKMTSCREKRSVVRALNTFSKQYKYIKCQETEVDLSVKPITLHYSDETYDSIFDGHNNKKQIVDADANYREEQEEKYKLSSDKSIVFKKEEALNDLRNTKNILDTVDNLMSLNHRPNIKEDLKKILKNRDVKGKNHFFLEEREALSLSEIEGIVDTSRFAKTIYSQIKSRIMFKRVGVYSTNAEDASITNGKIIKITPTDNISILKNQLTFILSELWLLDKDTIEKVEEIESRVNEEMFNEHFNHEHVDFIKNSSDFHPLEAAEYDDDSNNEITRRKSMTDAMLIREDHGLYDEELWSEYRELAEHYDERVSLLEDNIADIICCIEDPVEREDELNKNENVKQLLFDYRIEIAPFKKKELEKQLSLKFKDIEFFSNWYQYEELLKSFDPYEFTLNKYGIYLTYESYKEAFCEEKYAIDIHEYMSKTEKYMLQDMSYEELDNLYSKKYIAKGYHSYFADKYIEEERSVKELEEEEKRIAHATALQNEKDERIRVKLEKKKRIKEMREYLAKIEKKKQEEKLKIEKDLEIKKLIEKMNKSFKTKNADEEQRRKKEQEKKKFIESFIK